MRYRPFGLNVTGFRVAAHVPTRHIPYATGSTTVVTASTTRPSGP